MNREQSARRVVIALLVLIIATPAAAQDSHYWFDQFGNRALLLSGAVVGDPADLSSVYYNPGGLSLVEQTELLLAGLVLNYSKTKLADALAEGGDLTESHFEVAPSLIAGEIRAGGSKNRFAYSLLKRYGSDFLANGQVELSGDEFGVPVVELLANSARVDSDLSEYWAGGTWSYPVRPGLGVGVTTFVAVRNQRRFATNSVQVLTTGNRALVANASTDYKYQHWRLLWKIGVQGSFREWNIGAALTTPSIGMFGDGSVGNNFTLVGQTVDAAGDPLTNIATTYQAGVPVDYRSPLSIAFGAGRSFGSTTVHFTMEYFAPIDQYTVVDGQPFQGQTSGQTYGSAVVEQLDSVLNGAVGVEHRFNEDLLAYFGFHTDFNAASDNPAANLTDTKWNYYHLSGGATVRAIGRSFTLGGDLALARDTISVDAYDPFLPVGTPAEISASTYRITVLLGFSFLASM